MVNDGQASQEQSNAETKRPWWWLHYPAGYILLGSACFFLCMNLRPFNDAREIDSCLGWPQIFYDKYNNIFVFAEIALPLDICLGSVASLFIAAVVDWISRKRSKSQWFHRLPFRFSLRTMFLMSICMAFWLYLSIRDEGRLIGWPCLFLSRWDAEWQFSAWALLADVIFLAFVLWVFFYISHRVRIQVSQKQS